MASFFSMTKTVDQNSKIFNRQAIQPHVTKLERPKEHLTEEQVVDLGSTSDFFPERLRFQQIKKGDFEAVSKNQQNYFFCKRLWKCFPFPKISIFILQINC